MNYTAEQINELESIIAGIYYLSEESYRCGLDQVGLVLRASLAYIEGGTKDEEMGDIGESYSNGNLLELLDILDVIRKLPLEAKLKTLKLLEVNSLKDLH